MFNANEILSIAVQIEKNANVFYARAAEIVEQEHASQLFQKLADWEVSHIQIFSKLKEDLEGVVADAAQFDPNGEAGLYLQAVADGKIFKVDQREEDLAALSNDPQDIIQQAIAREKDSVIFYQAMMLMIPPGQGRDKVSEIVAEEMSHVRFLVSLAEEL